ncbi:MAG TPA: cation diffusion facilitator family transporter [Dongiaceae bacterium]|nr:cation diffusion facilitator family transporter [Dongiaceae bacterium]
MIVDSRRRRHMARANEHGSKKAVYAALAGNLTIAVTKCAAAWLTGSAAMLSEGAHSLVDSANEVLLLYGIKRAARPPDLAHPFGHGREAYFWSFIVALLFFLLGAGVSFYEGVEHVLHPQAIGWFSVTYAVLGVSALCEGYSLNVARREFAEQKGKLGYLDAIRYSKDPSVFTVLLEDSAAIAGLAIAFLGILGTQLLGEPRLDGMASIGVSLVLAVMAIFLAYETKSLLMGEPASPRLEAAILQAAAADPAVRAANGVFTVHLGPDQVVVELSLEFEPEARAVEIEDAVERIEVAVVNDYPEVAALFVKPQSAEEWRARHSRIEAESDPELRARAARRHSLRERYRAEAD